MANYCNMTDEEMERLSLRILTQLEAGGGDALLL